MTACRPGISADDIPWGIKPHVFERLGEGHYRLELPEVETVFDVDRLHRNRNGDLCGEVVASCILAGARTFQGTLYSGQVNLSDNYRRRDVASSLKQTLPGGACVGSLRWPDVSIQSQHSVIQITDSAVSGS